MTNSFKFIDLFAGIGGFRYALESLGGKCVFSSEWDKFASLQYQHNFGETPKGDITKVNAIEIPNHNFLTAGFPCQPFSQAGLKKGFNDTRGTLFFDVARIIEHHLPSLVLLENVKGFKNHDGGNTFSVVKRTLEDLGYEVHSQVLNAKDFGLPQNRERIFIVGIFRSKTRKSRFEFPVPNKKATKVGDILEKGVDKKYTISDKLWEGHQRRLAEHLSRGNGFGYSLFNENSTYTSTMSARYYKDGSEILIKQKGKNPRKITPIEASRLQGFPKNYEVVVSDVQAYKQFGNSVAVPVVRAVANEMLKLLK